jgi:hypothetical protein
MKQAFYVTSENIPMLFKLWYTREIYQYSSLPSKNGMRKVKICNVWFIYSPKEMNELLLTDQL